MATKMKSAPHIRASLWTGAILLAIDAVLAIIADACLQYCDERVVPAVTRIRFLAHPIADPIFNWIILTLFDGERRFLHVWTPTAAEAVRDAVLYNGLCFLEAFLYGLLLGMLASMLLARLRLR